MSGSSLGREAGAALRWNGWAAGVTLVSQLLQLALLARWLPPAEFGLAAVALAAVGFAQGFSDLGLAHALVQKPRVEERTWSSAAWACGLTGLVLFVAVGAFSPALETLLRLPGLTVPAFVAALLLPFAGASAVFQADLQRRLRFSRVAGVEIMAACASLLVALVWAWLRPEAMALVAGQIALVAIRCLGFFALSPLAILRAFPRASDLRSLASFGFYQMGERALTYAASNLDRLIVARLLGPAAAGIYTVASQIALRPLALLGPFVLRTLFPLLARMEEKERQASSFLRSITVLSPAAALAYTLLFGLADPLVRLVLGSGWEQAAPLLRILSALGFLWMISNPLGSLMLAQGRARAGFWITALVLAVNALAVWTGARFGLPGAALGMLAATAALLPLDFILLRRWAGLAPFSMAAAAFWPLPAALASLAVMHFLAGAGGLPPFAELALKGMAGVVVFFAVAFLHQGRRMRETWTELRTKLRDP
jgi:O-antigen/teichoic acid export membrane protein